MFEKEYRMLSQDVVQLVQHYPEKKPNFRTVTMDVTLFKRTFILLDLRSEKNYTLLAHL